MSRFALIHALESTNKTMLGIIQTMAFTPIFNSDHIKVDEANWAKADKALKRCKQNQGKK